MLNTDKLCPNCMNDSGGERICPVCGCDSTEQNGSDCLPVRSVIANRYTVGRAKKRNGEGITYIGWDSSESAPVTVREYFPAGFAVRNPDSTVGMKKGGEYTFNEGLMEFMDINRQIKASELPAHSAGRQQLIADKLRNGSYEEILYRRGNTPSQESYNLPKMY